MTTQGTVTDTFRCTSGVELNLHKPAGMALDRAIQDLSKTDPPPKVPTVWIEDKGRDEPNPNDPDYRQSYAVWAANASKRMFRVMVFTGTSVNSVPEGMLRHDEEAFAEYVVALQIGKPETKYDLYLIWVESVAAKDKDDLRLLTERLAQMAGLSAEDVAEAVNSFLGDAEQSTDNGSPNSGTSPNGNSNLG